MISRTIRIKCCTLQYSNSESRKTRSYAPQEEMLRIVRIRWNSHTQPSSEIKYMIANKRRLADSHHTCSFDTSEIATQDFEVVVPWIPDKNTARCTPAPRGRVEVPST